MEKTTRSLLTKFVIDKPNAKMVADNINVIKFIERQAQEFGIEKHTAFLEKVFHGKQVSAEHFFKVLTRVEAAIAKKASAKQVAKATKTAKKTAKPVAKATKTATTAKASRKPNAQKESVSSLEKLQTEIAKLVKVYNEKADNGKKVSITMSYIVAEIQ
jgi:hypothetical protein